jgi:putative transposase
MTAYYSCADLAAMKLPGFPATPKGWYELASREDLEYQEVKAAGGRGGIKRLYAPPAKALPLISGRESAQPQTIEQRRLQRIVASLAEIEADIAADQVARQKQAETVLAGIARLTDRESFSLQAHCQIAQSWQIWFCAIKPPLKKSASWEPYADAYNAREIPMAEAIREAFPQVSPRSVQRWVYEYERGHLDALVDRRSAARQRRSNTAFNAAPLLAAAASKMLLDKPGIRTQQLINLLATAATHPETGEQLFTPPTYGQVHRFQRAWIADHRDLYLRATNPDAWKNQSMLAFGSRSEDVTALNQRWEMDATPADWLLIDADGKKRRYTVSVIVDVWSRRILIIVSRTPKTVTHCLALRAALLAWGVPAEIVTDNGQDYQSDHFRHVLAALGITHLTTAPFSPEEKPHVERAIKTLNHSILELLPSFAGHSVADRKAIDSRESFAARLAKRGETIDFAATGAALTGSQMQATIDQWIAGIYQQRPHGALAGLSPHAKAASWTGETRRIADERALDILLARPAGGGQRTLQKKGIALDNTWFIAPELATIDMGSPVEIFETPDLGRIIVYHRGKFLCIAEAPERTGVDRQKIAEAASQMQRERIKAQSAEIKAATKGLPSTDDVVRRHLAEAARSAGKLVTAHFGVKAEHHSDGLAEAAKAAAAIAGPRPTNRAAELSAQARAAMAELPANVTPHPASRAHATPLEGMTAAEKYALWLDYDALVQAAGGDPETLPEAWQRRFWSGFPQSSIYRAQAALAGAQKEARGG